MISRRFGAMTLAAVIVIGGAQGAAVPAPVVAGDDGAAAAKPQLPRNFIGRGTYVVPSLGKRGVTVPFWWNGSNGNFRMVAGGPSHRIWFTNVLLRGNLYTYTYKWPGIKPVKCTPIPGASLAAFNQSLRRGSHLVGPEILLTPTVRDVTHWRLAGAFTPFHRIPIRFPVAQADIYVDPMNPRVWRKVLHYGYQNIYAQDMDEWIVLDTWRLAPGAVRLPKVCGG